jgi:hypothetical protein
MLLGLSPGTCHNLPRFTSRRSKSASLKAMEVKQGEEAAEEPRSHQDGSGFNICIHRWFKMVKYGLRFYTHTAIYIYIQLYTI